MPAFAAREVVMPLVDFVSQLRGFMPGEGSGGYVVPTLQEQEAFTAAARALLNGDVPRAEEALAAQPSFEVLLFTDGGGAQYRAIVEKPPLTRGWGFFLFAVKPARPQLLVEAPHPLADRDSELVAATTVTRLSPAAFLLAGAHRYADPAPRSDLAHPSSSVFEAIHEVVATASSVTLQIHGFSAAGHQGYPDLLLSTGSTDPGRDAPPLCEGLQAKGLNCVLFTGSAFNDLGATTNVQGGYSSRSFGKGHFLHFETDEAVRGDPTKFGLIIDAIGERWPPPRGCGCGSTDLPLLSFLALGLLGAKASNRVSRGDFR